MKLWVLCLNDMRFGNIESLAPVCRAETEAELVAFLESEKVEPYRDERWGKAFRKGGPLEWFNPPYDFDRHRHFAQMRTPERVMADYIHDIERVPDLCTLQPSSGVVTDGSRTTEEK